MDFEMVVVGVDSGVHGWILCFDVMYIWEVLDVS